MKTVNINASSSYKVMIGETLLAPLGAYVKECVGSCKICIVTDDKVDALYSDITKASLREEGYESDKFVIKNGEASKNASNLLLLLEFLAERRYTRSDCILALGGGVVGDLSGFAAAIYLRGIRYIQVPTTLLAAVDSSVGGKTAVDIKAGKNLVGAFHQPSLVICDIRTLDTLDKEVFADGCAEVIKYAIINDRPMFERLKNGICNDLENVIAECVSHKAEIVEADEFDRGCRQLLNLGHTIGHAVELCSNFTVSHGSAVAIGTVVITRAATALGLASSSDLDEVISIFKQVGLPTECPYTPEELFAAATADKKREGDTITLIIPYGIGDCRPYKIPVGELLDFIRKGV